MGVFATRFIPRGTLVWVLDCSDTVISGESFARLSHDERIHLSECAYQRRDGSYVLCADIARFVNHSCEPSARQLTESVEIAVRDVYPGDELTCEYGQLEHSLWAMRCCCGSPRCRGWVMPRDRLRYGALWKAEVLRAARLIPTVPQPLRHLLEAKETERLVIGREVTSEQGHR